MKEKVITCGAVVILLLVMVVIFFVLGKRKECMERTRKVIDCFTFFNELDLLEKRLAYMDPYVDKFIIAEAPTTHSGDEKPFYFEQNKDRFSEWKDKIIYIKTKPLGEGFWDHEKYKHLIPNKDHHLGEKFWKQWEREVQQRFAMEEELKNFDDSDIIIYSDIDEIPDMSKVNIDTIGSGNDVYFCKQRYFRYSFDYMLSTEFDWIGTKICTNKKAKEMGFIKLRDIHYDHKTLDECGWHMSKFGSEENASKIYKAFAHNGENDYVDEMKKKIDHTSKNPLVHTPNEIKESIPKILFSVKGEY